MDGDDKLATDQKPARKRAEQTRAIETRRGILQAALDEFAEFGFEGANVRRIAQRANTTHQLVNYHFQNKDVLWQETAALVLGEALDLITLNRTDTQEHDPTLTLKRELREMMAFHMAHPKIQRFVMQESVPGNPRLTWLVNAYLRPIRKSQTALLDAAQAQGGLMPGDTMLIFYLLVGAMTVMPTMAEEFMQNTGMSTIPDDLIDSYWTMLESVLFRAPINT